MSLPRTPVHFPRMKHRARKRVARHWGLPVWRRIEPKAPWVIYRYTDAESASTVDIERSRCPGRGVGIDYIVWDEPVFYPPNTDQVAR